MSEYIVKAMSDLYANVSFGGGGGGGGGGNSRGVGSGTSKYGSNSGITYMDGTRSSVTVNRGGRTTNYDRNDTNLDGGVSWGEALDAAVRGTTPGSGM